MGFNVLLWIFLLAALWGPSFLFIKIAVAEIPPLSLVMGRVGIAAVILYFILRWHGRNLPKFGKLWRHFAVMALVQNALPFALFNWGEQHIASALAAILNGTTPLFTILLAHLFTEDDHLTPRKGLGILLGFSGLLVLVAPSLMAGFQATTWGLLAVIGAAACYGIAMVYSRSNLRGLPPLVAPTAQLGLATLYMIPLALLFEQPLDRPWPSWGAVSSLLALSAFGTALAFVVFYRIIELTSATNLSMVTYLVPIFGVILGVVGLNEEIGWNAYAGCGLILIGVMIVNGVFKSVGWSGAGKMLLRILKRRAKPAARIIN